MSISGLGTRFARHGLGNALLVALMSVALLGATCPLSVLAMGSPQGPPPPGQPPPPYMQGTPQQLQQLVAPIALYPDQLVSQILAAATYPEQVVEADRWLQNHPGLQGEALARAVDQQPWDPSVKALTATPAVLGNMDKNLSWTSSLGDAYYNQQAGVMDAIQVMRQRAEQAGNLRTTSQQNVTNEGPNIVVQPADPEIVYVPEYDPWMVYGDPLMAWPGWYPYPGIWFGGPYLSFGVGFGIGFFGGFGWGWGHWGCNWGGHFATFGGGRYFSHSPTFYNRNGFYRAGRMGGGGFNRGGAVGGNGFRGGGAVGGQGFNRGGTARGGGSFSARPAPFNGNNRAARGYAAPRGQSGMRSGAFSGFSHGGEARGFSSRGRSSFGGGGFHGGGGGGFHGGGGGHR